MLEQVFEHGTEFNLMLVSVCLRAVLLYCQTSFVCFDDRKVRDYLYSSRCNAHLFFVWATKDLLWPVINQL